jgi:hypothetical protein
MSKVKFSKQKFSTHSPQANVGDSHGRTTAFNSLISKKGLSFEQMKSEIEQYRNEALSHKDHYGNNFLSVLCFYANQTQDLDKTIDHVLTLKNSNGEYTFNPFGQDTIQIYHDAKLDMGEASYSSSGAHGEVVRTDFVTFFYEKRVGAANLTSDTSNKIKDVLKTHWVTRVQEECTQPNPNLEPYLNSHLLQEFFNDTDNSPLKEGFATIFKSGMVDMEHVYAIINELPSYDAQINATVFITGLGSTEIESDYTAINMGDYTHEELAKKVLAETEEQNKAVDCTGSTTFDLIDL